MKFKEPHMYDQLRDSSVILQLMVDDFVNFAGMHFKKDCMITRVWDPVPGETGVHPDKRAVDIRQEHEGEKVFTDTEANALVNFLNGKWHRLDGRPTCLLHSFQGGPQHFHIQVSQYVKQYERG